jgi:Tol biopolymer transport system component
VTREEARGTVEFLLGVQMLGSQPVRLPGPARPGAAMLPPGWEFANVPLRSSKAHVLNLIHFRQLDGDRSGALNQRELGNLGVAGLDPSTVLAGCDADKDGQISPAEWWQVPIAGAANTIAEFQAVDGNQDGYLDREELQNVPSYKLKVASHALPAFDFDGDGKLSLGEYRFTPLANPLVDWNRDLADADGSLTFAEYIDRSEPFVLLYWNYFQKFDLNSDGVLDTDEYSFRARTPEAVYGLNADGTGWAKLFQWPGYPVCGSVAVSPDGRKIACDAWKVGQGQAGRPMVLVADIDGQNVRELCQGQMPSWSPDGKFFVCSRIENHGVWIMTADGEEHRRVGDGWSGQWSPDGKKIAYYLGPRLLVYDVETGMSHDVLDEARAYEQVFWNMCWSPDSRQICFRGISMEQREELVLVDAAGAERGIKVRFGGEPFSSKFAWHPTASRLVFSKPCPERRIMQLYEVDPRTDAPPVLVAGQDPHTHNEDPTWTPDGKRLILVRGNYY